MTKIDLSDKAIAAALNRLLDEIAETARVTSPTGRCPPVLALRLGVSTWQAQRAAKTLGRRGR